MAGQSDTQAKVTRYLAASRQAFQLIQTLPITQRLILDVHRTLLSGVRGEDKDPGRFRRTPVIGRLLISLLLMERRRLDLPLLYLSSYFETHRDEYYNALQRVRASGDIDTWLLLFFEAVRAQSDDAVWRARKLVDLRESYLLEASKTRSKLPHLVQAMVANPYVTVASAQSATGLSAPGARGLVRRAEELGWLRSLGTHGRGGREQRCAPALLEIIESPMRYE